MRRKYIVFLIMLFVTVGLLADTYTVSGVGREGDPFVFVDGKITFVTNLTPQQAPEGTRIEIYNLQERQNVNFAEGRLLGQKEPEPQKTEQPVYTVSGVGSEGDPFVFIDGKITFVTNMTPQQAPEGTRIEIYNLQERQNVNFAEGRLLTERETEPQKTEKPVYTVAGIGRDGDGDPFVFIDGKITFVTNLTPNKAPVGTKITLYDLQERQTVNFAKGSLLEDKEKETVEKKIPDNVHRVAGIGREGDPFVRINDKVTFVTNMTGEQAPQGTLVEIYDLQERQAVNFAQGRIYTPPEERKKEVEKKSPEQKEIDQDKELQENDTIELTVSMVSATGTGMGFYGRYLVYVSDTQAGQTVQVRIDSIEDHIARGTKIE